MVLKLDSYVDEVLRSNSFWNDVIGGGCEWKDQNIWEEDWQFDDRSGKSQECGGCGIVLQAPT